MTEFLLPRTDAGALAQVVALAVLGPIAVAATWRHHDLRLFSIGVVVAAAAWMALRTVH